MIARPGHLARGGSLRHNLLVERVCACGVAIVGPRTIKRCEACRKRWRPIEQHRQYLEEET